MTDPMYAIFNNAALMECDICDDRVRLVWPDATTDRHVWQEFVNAWQVEHHGHFYIESAPSTMAGPLAFYPSADTVVRRCDEAEP